MVKIDPLKLINPILYLVEDDPIFREAFDWVLQDAGISTENLNVFERADDMINFLKGSDYDGVVAFIDLNFDNSHTDGFAVLKYMQEHNIKGVKAVVSTTVNRQEMERTKRLGASCYIVKAFEIKATDKLSEKIRQFSQDYLENGLDKFKVYE